MTYIDDAVAAYEAERQENLAAITRDTPEGYMLSMGVPYAHQLPNNAVICPNCGQHIQQTERKDFESFTGYEYADHYMEQHAIEDGLRLIHGRWYEPV